MLQLLSDKNILNLYLSFHLDIVKLKRLFNFEFNLKQHQFAIIKTNFLTKRSPKKYYTREFYVDRLLTCEKLSYLNRYNKEIKIHRKNYTYENCESCKKILHSGLIYYKLYLYHCNYFQKNNYCNNDMIYKEYHKNGKIKLSGNQRMNRWHGFLTRYTKKGKMQYKKYFNDGENINEIRILKIKNTY
jgi:hypothetical protein